MDHQDRAILTYLQREFPLVPKPFESLSQLLHRPATELIAQVRRLKAEGFIRQISAIFDTTALGYTSSLVAFRVAPADVETAAEAINAHPGVSHNYLREHDFNIWFTLAVPPGADLKRDIATLAREAKAIESLPLPTLRLYKIGVKLDLLDTEPQEYEARDVPGQSKVFEPRPLADTDIQIIRALQDDLEITEQPFAAPAGACGMTEEELLDSARRFARDGRMRRFAAVVRHRKVGFLANGMITWQVPQGREDAVGEQLARFKAVSHCYRRPTGAAWPYAVFTMVHAKDRAQCEHVATRMAQAIGIDAYRILYSIREFKKTRVRYFTDAYPLWVDAHV